MTKLDSKVEERLELFYEQQEELSKNWRILKGTSLKDTELRTKTLVSVMKKKRVNQLVRQFLLQCERVVSGLEETQIMTLLSNDNIAHQVLNFEHFKGSIRSVTGLSLRMGVNLNTPLILCASPVERKIKNKDDRSPIALQQFATEGLGTPGYEIQGWLNYMGPACDILIYGGKDVLGSSSRAANTRASEECLRALGREDFVLVDLSNPNTIPHDAVEDWDTFLAPYVVAIERNGVPVEHKQDGSVDALATWKTQMAHLSDKEVKMKLGVPFRDGVQKCEVDGEILLTEETANAYGIHRGGLQFRATETLTDHATDYLNRIGLEWSARARDNFDSANQWALDTVDSMCESSLNGGSQLTADGNACPVPGIYKGAAFPRAGLKKNLMDVNAIKGRNKRLLKDLMGSNMRLAFGIVAGQEEEGQVSNSWQTYYLLFKGSIETYVKNLSTTIKSGCGDLLNRAQLAPWLQNYLCSGVMVDKEVEDSSESDDETSELSDPLTVVMKNWNLMRELTPEVNWAAHPVLANKIFRQVTRFSLKSVFGFLPYGQMKENFDGETRVRASISYLWSAIDLPAQGIITIEEEGKRPVKIAATCAYHHDSRFWGKVGLVWRYPIFKDTTIIPCLFLEPPKYYDLEEGCPTMFGMNQAAIKVLLFGDTDGDKVCFMKFHIQSDQPSETTFGSNGFRTTIQRTSGKPEDDDYALLMAYGAIKSGMMERPSQFDPCKVLDEGPDAKKPLDVSWLNVLEPWIVGEDSRRVVSAVSLMAQASTRLEGEIQILETLLRGESFTTKRDSKITTIYLDRGLSLKEKARCAELLAQSRKVVDSLYKWAPLQGESSVMGAKHNTWGGHRKAIESTIEGTFHLVQEFCNTCKKKEQCDKSPEIKDACPATKFKDLHGLVTSGNLSSEHLDNVNSAYTVLLETTRLKLEETRKIMLGGSYGSGIKRKQGNGAPVKALSSSAMGYNPRSGSVAMSNKPDANVILELQGADFEKGLRTLCVEPELLHDVTTRAVNHIREDVIRLCNSFRVWRDGKKYSRQGTAISRTQWANLIASRDDQDNIIQVDRLVDEKELLGIHRFLRAHDILKKFMIRVPVPLVHYIQIPKGTEYSKDAARETLESMERVISKCTCYGDLRLVGIMISYLITGVWRDEIEGAPFPKCSRGGIEDLVPRDFTHCAPDGVWPEIMKEFGVDEWNQIPQVLNRPNKWMITKTFMARFSDRERDTWASTSLKYQASLSEWLFTATKPEIEVMWRLGHNSGFGDTTETKYSFGPTIAIQALFQHLDKFKDCFGVNARVKDSEIIGPITVQFDSDKIPVKGDVIGLQMVERERKNEMGLYMKVHHETGEGYVLKSSAARRPPLRALFPAHTPFDIEWEEPRQYKVLDIQPEVYYKDIVLRDGTVKHLKGESLETENGLTAVTLIQFVD